MVDYLPLLMIALMLLLVCLAIAWPWLRLPGSRDKALMFCGVGLFLSLAIYMMVGSPFSVGYIAEQQKQQAELLARIAALKAELSAASGSADMPEHAAKWLELGSSYMQLNQPKLAVEALRHAVLASNGEPQWILLYGKAQMAAADGAMTEDAERAFVMASNLMPEEPEPLFLLAVGRMQQGDREGARVYFRELLPLLPEGAPLRQRILERLQQSEAN